MESLVLSQNEVIHPCKLNLFNGLMLDELCCIASCRSTKEVPSLGYLDYVDNT